MPTPATAVAGPVALGGSGLYRCRIKHRRTTPIRHGFSYRTHLWLVDLDDPPKLPRPLGPLARFRAADHLGPGSWREKGSGRLGRTIDSATTEDGAGAAADPDPLDGDGDGGPGQIKAELIRWCGKQNVDVSGCRILMLTAARSFGYVFNPLTVFWCLGADGSARHVIAEVHNTYGARHCYLFQPQDGPTGIDKQFYVSPFFAVEGGYRMTVPVPGERLHIAITLTLPDGTTPFVATVRGDRRPAGTAEFLRTLARDPLAGYRVPLSIRYQAVRMLLRGLRIKPGHRGPGPDSAAAAAAVRCPVGAHGSAPTPASEPASGLEPVDGIARP
jgi:uncharacterized protein